MKAHASGWGGLAVGFLILLLAACAISKPVPTPTLTPSQTRLASPTITPVPATSTRTPRPTVTLWPTDTPTLTETPFFTSTPTPSETPATPRLAQLFPFHDAEGTTIDWSYARLTSVKLNSSGQVKSMSAFLAFQLLDRAIHRITIKLFGSDITYYYLDTRHQFGTEEQPMALIIGATYGKDIPIQEIPAGGSSYTLVRRMSPSDRFDALGILYQISLPIRLRKDYYQDMPLLDLQTLLAGLPDPLIVLANHPILVDPDGYQQLYNDITSVSYLAARYTPFIQIDAYDRIAGPTPAALALKEYLLHGTLPTIPVTAYSSDVLILLTKP